MRVGDLVIGKGSNEMGIVLSFGIGFARVHWADGNWSWEESRYLQEVINASR